MKAMKKHLWMAATVLAAVTTGCTNEDNPVIDEPDVQQARVYTLTTTLSPKGGTETRSILTDPGDGTLYAEWEKGDKVWVSYTKTDNSLAEAQGEVTAVDPTTKAATITVTLTDPKDGKEAQFGIPYDHWHLGTSMEQGQDGTLNNLNTMYSVMYGMGTINVSGDEVTLPTGVTMIPENAIWKFTFSDLGTPITSDIISLDVCFGDYDHHIITPSGLSAIYVAVFGDDANYSAPRDVTITARTATKLYTTSKTGVMLWAGKLYTSNVVLTPLDGAPPMNMAVASDIGSLIGDDGKIYATKAAANAATATPVAVIAYVGSDAFTERSTAPGGGHGLALCLKNAASDVCWSTEKTAYEFGEAATVNSVATLKRSDNVSGYTNTTTLAAKTDAGTKYPAAYQAKNYTGLTAPTASTGWFLPTAQQWVKMIEGLGGLADGAPGWQQWFDNNHTAADKWEAALAKAGSGNYDSMTSDHLYYFSSSECGYSAAVLLEVDARYTGSSYSLRWNWTSKDAEYSYYRVRPVFAF